MEAKEDEDLEVPAERNTEFRHICGLQKCTLPTFILSIGSPLLWVSLPMPGRLLLLSLFFSSFFFFFFCFQTNCAVWRSGPTSDNVFFFFAIFIFISQMGFGSQGHKSWKTDGPRRHQGHCGHNESAYVCSFTVPSTTTPLFIPYPPDYWSHHLHLPVDRYMGSLIQGINHKAGREHTTECWIWQNAKIDKRLLFSSYILWVSLLRWSIFCLRTVSKFITGAVLLTEIGWKQKFT